MTLLDEFRARGVYRTGHFRLSSGRHSDTYLQCALALQDPAFASRLGHELADRVRPMDVELVVSPALGGVLAGFVVAQALGRRFLFTERRDGTMTLRRGQAIGDREPVVVVEDVLTTGGSAREAAEVVAAEGGAVVGYAALVDRSTDEHPLPFEAVALLDVDARTWEASGCELCAAGVAVDAPGSRVAPA